MDALSHLLDLVSVRSVEPARLEAAGAWSLGYAADPKVRFGQVLCGEIWIGRDESEHRLSSGACFVLATGEACTIASGPGLRPGSGSAVCTTSTGGMARLGRGDETVLEGGMIRLDPASIRSVLGLLPSLVVIDGGSPDARSVRIALAQFFGEARSEQPGATLAAASLGRLVCLAAVRQALRDGDPGQPGWLAAFADPLLGDAVRALHADPGRLWTVSELADLAHMTRSSFSRRFHAVTGEAPLGYVLALRMRIASQEVRRPDRTVASVGEAAGYSSEAAFSRAFKRVIGVPPSRWRTESVS